MRVSLIITVIGSIFLFSCNQPEEKKVEIEPKVAEEHQHSESDSIELNNGAKWKVVPEMMKHIRNMETEVNLFSENKHSDLKDFSQLGASLQKNIDLLTSNCTMEGKAHDELHKWLLPYIDMVDKLNKATTVTETETIYQQIRISFQTFNIYFE